MNNRSRAAILPDTGDPFVSLFWLHFFKKYWGTEIDKLYYCLNSPVESEIVGMLCVAFQRAGAEIIYRPVIRDHGDAIADVLPLVKEKHVMLIETDGIIFGANKVDECFKRLELDGYDIVSDVRGSASLSLIAAEQKKFGLGDEMPHFYPNFFFTLTDNLRATDKHFGSKQWKAGEHIQELDWDVVPDPGADVIAADTFGWTSIQLRAQNPKVWLEKQYHAYPHDPQFKEQGEHLWDGQARWLHYGSVSTGTMGAITDRNGIPMNDRFTNGANSWFVNGELPPIVVPDAQLEYERRAGYWAMCIRVVGELIPRDYYNNYIEGWTRFVRVNQLNEDIVDLYANLYTNLLQI